MNINHHQIVDEYLTLFKTLSITHPTIIKYEIDHADDPFIANLLKIRQENDLTRKRILKNYREITMLWVYMVIMVVGTVTALVLVFNK